MSSEIEPSEATAASNTQLRDATSGSTDEQILCAAAHSIAGSLVDVICTSTDELRRVQCMELAGAQDASALRAEIDRRLVEYLRQSRGAGAAAKREPKAKGRGAGKAEAEAEVGVTETGAGLLPDVDDLQFVQMDTQPFEDSFHPAA